MALCFPRDGKLWKKMLNSRFEGHGKDWQGGEEGLCGKKRWSLYSVPVPFPPPAALLVLLLFLLPLLLHVFLVTIINIISRNNGKSNKS